MFTQKSIKIFHSVQEIGLFSLFQNLNLGNASANPKWHLTIPWATSCQYQCICKILSKYSKRFKSYRHFSRTGRGQNLHKLSGDKIKCLIIVYSMKFNFKFQLTFLRSCNYTKACVSDSCINLFVYVFSVKSTNRIMDKLTTGVVGTAA